MATDAGAQIVDYGAAPPAATLNAPSNGGVGNLAFAVGPAEFDLVAVHTSYGGVAFGASAKAGILANATSFGAVRKLASGANISGGAGMTFQGDLHPVREVFPSFTAGSFKTGVPAFAGIEFNTGANPSSASSKNPTKIHYGWVELKFSGAIPNSIQAISWAYNPVAGQAITAGQTNDPDTSATPEPGTAALSLLAMGAAGVLAWRRKKAALDLQ